MAGQLISFRGKITSVQDSCRFAGKETTDRCDSSGKRRVCSWCQQLGSRTKRTRVALQITDSVVAERKYQALRT
jgi:hypothetical protein